MGRRVGGIVVRWYRRGGMCLARDPLAVPGNQVRLRIPRTIVHGRQVFPVKERQ